MMGLLEIAFGLSLLVIGGLTWAAWRLNHDINMLMRRTAENSVRIWKIECAGMDDGR